MSQIEKRDFIMRASEKEIKDAIRERLTSELRKRVGDHVRHGDLSKDHLRFDMSGYGLGDNDCYFHNLEILKLFSDYGIWDYVSYLYLDAYKGTITLHWGWWDNSVPNDWEIDVDRSYCSIGNFSTEDMYCGWTTTDIIYDIINRVSIEPRKFGWNVRRFF